MYISILYLFVLSASCIMMMLANKVLFYSILELWVVTVTPLNTYLLQRGSISKYIVSKNKQFTGYVTHIIYCTPSYSGVHVIRMVSEQAAVRATPVADVIGSMYIIHVD